MLSDIQAEFGHGTSGRDAGERVYPGCALRQPEMVWVLATEASSAPLSERIEEILLWAEERKVELARCAQDASIDVYCSVFMSETGQGGLEVSTDHLRRLASLGLTFGVSIVG